MIGLLLLAITVAGARLPESARRPPNIPDNEGRRTITLKEAEPSSLDSLSSPALSVREPGVSTISLQLAGDQTFPQPPAVQEDSLPTINVGGRVFSNSKTVFNVPAERKVVRQQFQPRVPFLPQRREQLKPLPVVSLTRQPVSTSFVQRQEENNEAFRPYSFQFEVADDEEQTYHARQEEADESGEVRGVYSFVDPFGSLVTVNYRLVLLRWLCSGVRLVAKFIDLSNAFLT